MIDERCRFFAFSGELVVGGPSTWHVMDWDQLRAFGVTTEHVEEDEYVSIGYLRKYIDVLNDRVYAINVGRDGQLISASEDPENDVTNCAYYTPLELFQNCRPGPLKAISRFDLVELDRYAPNIDMVSYSDSDSGDVTKGVFKYYIHGGAAASMWNEINIWSRLPYHPNIVSFDRVVLDDGRVVGFTSLYLPNGSLADNKTRVFKLRWLKQLVQVVDDLNSWGIMHQDVAPRNLLINPETDDILLFDFDVSVQIGSDKHHGFRDDTKGVAFTLYETITQDYHFRQVDYPEQHLADIEGLEWTQHPDVSLDSPVSSYRSMLDEWMVRRANESLLNSGEHISWPPFPEPPVVIDELPQPDGRIVTIEGRPLWEIRRVMRSKGDNSYVKWERPPSMIQNGNGLAHNKPILNPSSSVEP